MRICESLLIALVVASLVFALGGCGAVGAPTSAESTPEHGHAEEQLGAAHAHGDDDEAADASALTPEAIRAVRCEHDMPMFQCAECRYEVGVAKADRSLFKEASADGILRLAQAAMREEASTVFVTGEIRLDENRTVHITPRIPGIVQSVHVDIGSVVQAGDLLLEIDSIELGTAMGEYEKNRSLTAVAAKNYEREKNLWERKIGAEVDMLEARARLDEVQTAFRAAEQRLHVLGLTDEDMANAESTAHSRLRGALPIRAPQPGTVLTRHASVGEAVEAARELMVLSDLGSVWAWLDVFDVDLERVLAARQSGDVPVEIRVRAFPGKVFTGLLDRVGPVMEEQTRTVKTRAIVANPEGLLRPGMFCEAGLALPGDGEVLTVPTGAVLSDAGADFVFVPFEEDYFRRQDVRKGREFAGEVEILEGLAPDETVVAEGAFMLKSDVLRSKMGAGCAD